MDLIFVVVTAALPIITELLKRWPALKEAAAGINILVGAAAGVAIWGAINRDPSQLRDFLEMGIAAGAVGTGGYSARKALSARSVELRKLGHLLSAQNSFQALRQQDSATRPEPAAAFGGAKPDTDPVGWAEARAAWDQVTQRESSIDSSQRPTESSKEE